jgi:predicted amidophosphoribosyltransferase
MNYTGFGNYRCQECGHAMNDMVHRPSNCDIPMHQGFGKQEGWICPVCGRGLAPWVDYCPCQGSEMKITYGTSTGGDKPDGWQEYFDLFEKKNNIGRDEV